MNEERYDSRRRLLLVVVVVCLLRVLLLLLLRCRRRLRPPGLSFSHVRTSLALILCFWHFVSCNFFSLGGFFFLPCIFRCFHGGVFLRRFPLLLFLLFDESLLSFQCTQYSGGNKLFCFSFNEHILSKKNYTQFFDALFFPFSLQYDCFWVVSFCLVAIAYWPKVFHWKGGWLWYTCCTASNAFSDRQCCGEGLYQPHDANSRLWKGGTGRRYCCRWQRWDLSTLRLLPWIIDDTLDDLSRTDCSWSWELLFQRQQ